MVWNKKRSVHFMLALKSAGCDNKSTEAHGAPEGKEMTKQEINAKYNAMYAQLVEWQTAGEHVCTKWMAEFGRIADMDYAANKELYA